MWSQVALQTEVRKQVHKSCHAGQHLADREAASRMPLASSINAADDAERGCDMHLEVAGKSQSSSIPTERANCNFRRALDCPHASAVFVRQIGQVLLGYVRHEPRFLRRERYYLSAADTWRAAVSDVVSLRSLRPPTNHLHSITSSSPPIW